MKYIALAFFILFTQYVVWVDHRNIWLNVLNIVLWGIALKVTIWRKV